MRNNGGFTLIELILVTVIIGVLSAMVVPVIVHRLTDAKIRAAKGDIAAYEGAVQEFALDHEDRLPTTLAELADPKSGRIYVKRLNKDPWLNDYLYVPGADPKLGDFKVFSAGKDGIPDTPDEVTADTPDPVQEKVKEAGNTSK